MAHHDRSARVRSLLICVLGMVVSFTLAACDTQSLSKTSTPPSPTPPPLPISPTQAWGNYPSTHISLPLPSTTFFAPKDIFPDGSQIAGVAQHTGHMQVMLAQVASGATRVLYTAPSDLATTLDVRTDGRFVAWAGGNEGEGAQSQHNVIGYSDVQSGTVTMLDDGNHYEHVMQLIHGTLIWSKHADNASGPALVATDLATKTTTTLSITPDWNCDSASWPYLLCNQANGIKRWELYNLATHQATTPTSLGNITQSTGGYLAALDGTAAFVLPAAGGPSNAQPAQLMEIDQVDQPSAKPHGTGLTFVARTLMANSRLVVWTGNRDGSNVTNQVYAWDRAQKRLVEFDPTQFHDRPQVILRDHTMMFIDWSGFNQATITVINTDTLPKAAGA